MKPMKKKLTFLICIGLLCLVSACRKKNNPMPISTDLIKYFDYKIGTYWIFRDSISGRIDSFCVTNNQFSTNLNGSNEDNIDIPIAEYTGGHINPDSLTWSIDLNSNWFMLNIKSPKPYFTYVTNAQPLFTYPFTVSQQLSILLTFSINGNNYINVAQIVQNTESVGSSNPYAYNDLFYVNSDIGFVKLRISHPGSNIYYVWELQRNNIIH
jgi:hypothetical protein